MTRRNYSRKNVRTHYGSDRPAVNVKMPYGTLSEGLAAFLRNASGEHGRVDPRFTLEWIEENVSDEALDSIFWDVCAFEFEYAQGLAAEMLGVREDDVEHDGRSGGWLVVTGLPDIEEWDAVQLAKWRSFEKQARAIADDVPYLIVNSIYMNQWEKREDDDDPGAESPVAEYLSCEEIVRKRVQS